MKCAARICANSSGDSNSCFFARAYTVFFIVSVGMQGELSPVGVDAVEVTAEDDCRGELPQSVHGSLPHHLRQPHIALPVAVVRQARHGSALRHRVQQPQPRDLRDLREGGGDLLLPGVREPPGECGQDGLLPVFPRADDEGKAELLPVLRG